VRFRASLLSFAAIFIAPFCFRIAPVLFGTHFSTSHCFWITPTILFASDPFFTLFRSALYREHFGIYHVLDNLSVHIHISKDIVFEHTFM